LLEKTHYSLYIAVFVAVLIFKKPWLLISDVVSYIGLQATAVANLLL